MPESRSHTSLKRYLLGTTIAALALSAVNVTSGGALITRDSTISNNTIGPDFTAERTLATFSGNNSGNFGARQPWTAANFKPVNQEHFLPAPEDIAKFEQDSDFSYALSHTGEMYIWGYMPKGKNGAGGANQAIYEPRKFDFSGTKVEGDPIVDVAVGTSSVFAIDSEGDVVAWGSTEQGRLGIGQTDTKWAKPADVLQSEMGKVKAVYPVVDGTLFVNERNELWAAGDERVIRNDHTGATERPQWTPINVSDAGFPFAASDIVKTLDIDPTSHMYREGARPGASIVLTQYGEVFSWGWDLDAADPANFYGIGILGHGTENRRVAKATQIPELAGLPVVDIQHSIWKGTVGALTQDGAAFTWGDGGEGRQGNGSTAHVFSPAHLDFGQPVAQISIGALHAGAVLSDGSAMLWGKNSSGANTGNAFGSAFPGGEYLSPVTVPKNITPLKGNAVAGIRALLNSTRIDVVTNASGSRVPAFDTVTTKPDPTKSEDTSLVQAPVNLDSDRYTTDSDGTLTVSGTGTPGAEVTIEGTRIFEEASAAKETVTEELLTPGSDDVEHNENKPAQPESALEVIDERSTTLPEELIEPAEEAAADDADRSQKTEEEAQADESLSMTDPDVLGTAVVSESGSWKVEIATPIPAEFAALVARQDSDHSSARAVVEQSAATITIDSEITTGSDGFIRISGTSTSADSLQLSVDGRLVNDNLEVLQNEWTLDIPEFDAKPVLIRVSNSAGEFTSRWLTSPTSQTSE